MKVSQEEEPSSRIISHSEDIYGISDDERERRASQRAKMQQESKRHEEEGPQTTTTRRRSARHSSRSSTARPEPVTAAEDDGDSPAVEVGRRNVGAVADVSGLDLGALGDDVAADVFGDIDGSFDLGASIGGSGTRSSDNSTLDVGSFRRRLSRSISGRPSILGGRPASKGRGVGVVATPSGLDLGRFKPRKREPSILGRQDGDVEAENQEVRDVPSGAEDDNVTSTFAPDAESTPLNKRLRGRPRNASSAAATAVGVQVPRRGRSAAVEPSSELSTTVSSAGRKRKRRQHDEAEEQPEEAEQRDLEVEPVAGETTQDEDELPSPGDINVGSMLPPPSRRRSQRHQGQPSQPSQPSTPVRGGLAAIAANAANLAALDRPADTASVLAPPASSDSEDADGSPVLPSLRNIARQRNRRPRGGGQQYGDSPVSLDDDGESDISEPPSLTHSPDPVPTAARRIAKRGQNVSAQLRHRREKTPTTEDLVTSLLPKRRRRVRKGGDDPFDIADDHASLSERDAMSSTDEDGTDADDEESYARTRRRRLRRLAKASNTNTKSNQNSKDTTGVATASEPQQGPRTKRRRTYGREEIEADKENEAGSPVQEHEGNGSEEAPRRKDMGEELRRAITKFREVDRWELSFETVAPPTSSPRMADAR